MLVLCILGRVASSTNYLQDFQRFHRYLSMDTVYYPTASQLRQLARASLSEGRVLVIVGGSSVMYGVGQGSSELWSDELQQVLGPAYVVLNFAGGGTAMTDYGGVAAQILHADGYPVVFVTDIGPAGGGDPDGLRARYVYWDAYYKGLLPSDAGRMLQIESLASSRGTKDELDELKLRGLVEGIFYQTEFWNWVGYNVVFTVPNYLIRLPYAWFTAPRKTFVDPVFVATLPPVSDRYPPSQVDTQTSLLKAYTQVACVVHDSGAVVERERDPPVSASMAQSMEGALPEEVRRRTIIALIRESLFLTDRLPADQQACYFDARVRMATTLSVLGYHPVHAGLTMSAEDYADRVHLAPSGGRIVARDLASAILDLSVDLGYVDADTASASAREGRAELARLQALMDAGEGPFGELEQLLAQARLVRSLDQRLEGLLDDVDRAEAAASEARVEAQLLRAWIDAGGPVSQADGQQQRQAQQQAVQEREQRQQELAAEVSEARVRAAHARREAERLRAEIDAGRGAPGAMERLQAEERSLEERERRLRDLLRKTDEGRVAADEARSEPTRVRSENFADRALSEAMERLQAAERSLQERERRLRDRLREVEEARAALDEVRSELSQRCGRLDSKRAFSGVTTRLQELEIRKRERLLCSGLTTGTAG